MYRLFVTVALLMLTFPALSQDLATLKAELAEIVAREEQRKAPPVIQTVAYKPSYSATVPVDPPAEKRAPLVITFWDKRECAAGAKTEREVVAYLAWEGWRNGKHYEIVRDDSAEICPQFEFKGVRFSREGYPGWKDFRLRLAGVMGVDLPNTVAAVAQPDKVKQIVNSAPVVEERQFSTTPIPGIPIIREGQEYLPGVDPCPDFQGIFNQAPIRMGIPPARRQWYQNGHSVTAAHLRSHGIDPTGMSQQEMDRAHSHAHEGTWDDVQRSSYAQGGYTQPAGMKQRAFYAQPMRRVITAPFRVMGSVFGAAGCPSGACPR